MPEPTVTVKTIETQSHAKVRDIEFVDMLRQPVEIELVITPDRTVYVTIAQHTPKGPRYVSFPVTVETLNEIASNLESIG